MDAFKKKTPEITKEVNDLFSKIKPGEKFKYLLNDVYHSDTFKNTDFKKFVDGLSASEKRALTAGEALKKYKTHLESVGKTTSIAAKAMSGLKKVGSIVASMSTTFLVMEGISLALKALDDYTHQYTRALENASTAADEYATQKSNVQALASEYDTLQSKIRELQALQLNGDITMQQEVELVNLQNQSAELERQLDIQKQILDAKAQVSADAAIF